MCRQFLHLLRAGVLARKVDVLVERHRCPFLRCPRSPRREAPRTLRERLECSEGGNTGRRTGKVLPSPHGGHGRPFSPRPGSSGKQGLYAPCAETQADQLSGVGSDVWMSSARRTARVTPSRIWPGFAATELSIWRSFCSLPRRVSRLCCKSFCP